MPPSSSSGTEPLAGPTPWCRRFAAVCRELVEGAIDGRQYESAWSTLRGLFGASGVRLLRDVQAPANGWLEGPPVHALEQRSAPEPLRGLLALDGARYGLVAFVRRRQQRCDAVLVLRSTRPFTGAERAWMELMLSPMRAALEAGDQLASATPTLAAAVQLARRVPTPCALIDPAGRCREQNASFAATIESIPGAVRDGRVTFDDPFLQDSWQQALLHADRTATTQSLLTATRNGEQWKIHVVPFPCAVGPTAPARSQLLLAQFEKHARAGTQPHMVPASRPLTKAELEVLANLRQGRTAKAIARERGASIHTVRSQIATILAKTGHRTQKELLALFGSV